MDRLWVPERGKPGEARGRKHRPRAGQPGSELTSACDDLVTWLPWPGSPRTAGRTSPPLGCRSPAASAAASGGALPTTALPRVQKDRRITLLADAPTELAMLCLVITKLLSAKWFKMFDKPITKPSKEMLPFQGLES